MTSKVNEELIQTYHYAGCGDWSNPLTGTPSIKVQIWRVHDVIVPAIPATEDTPEIPATTKTEMINVVGYKNIPYTPAKVIDPSLHDIPLPPITHEVFYGYMKAMLLDAMIEG